MTENIDITITAKDNFSGAFSKIGSNIIVLNQALQLTKSILGPVVDGLGAVLETADKFKRLEIQLTSLTGSAVGARASMGRLIELAKKSPFTVDALANSFAKMTAGGLGDANRTLRALTDAVAAFGGTNETLKRASIAIQQMAGKGTISMEELRQQLGEAIPTAMRVMAREMGLTMKVFTKQVSLGMISAEKGISALTIGLEKDFKGAGLRMMDTWTGVTSNLRDAWDLFMVALGDTGILDAAISSMKSLIGVVNDVTESVKNLFGITITRNDLLREIKKTEAGIQKLGIIIRRNSGFLNLLSGGMESNKKKFSELLFRLADLRGELQKLDEAQAKTTETTKEVAKAVDIWKDNYSDFSGVLKIVNEGMKEAITAGENLAVVLAERLAVSAKAVAIEIRQAVVELAKLEAKVGRKLVLQLTSGAPSPVTFAPGSREFANQLDGGVGVGLNRLMVQQGAMGAAQGAFSVAQGGLGSIAGASGALQGLEAGGPMGAIAGFFTELLLKNEKMQAILGKISEVLIALMDPIAEAIGPMLEAVLPIIKALAPVFKVIGITLERYLRPMVIALEAITKAMTTLERMLLKLRETIQSWDPTGQGFTPGSNSVVGKIASALGFHDGGVIQRSDLIQVPGTRNDEGFAFVQAGEEVIPKGGSRGQGVVINVRAIDARSVGEEIRQVVEEMQALGRLGTA